MKTMNRLRAVFALPLLLATTAAGAATVNWEGWEFDYTTSNNSSGLVLTDVRHNSKKILDKASMPVMRVQYDNDICGPYADIMSSGTLRAATQGAPNSACDNQSVCQRTFTINGEKMLEVGSNWQIGEYQIYQTYYFSEQGYFDARIYSRGLQCNVNHSHHAHWMFDFDIEDAENDRIVLPDGSVPTVEFNDQKANTAFWTVEDANTNHSVRLIPSDDDGTPGNFAQWDVAVRAYNSSEVGRWRLGARGEIGTNYLNNQSIDSDDLVFWYVSHLPHSASEGEDLWHASGPRIEVDDGGTQPPPDPDPDPDPVPTGPNLLANGDFEGSKAGWYDCGPSSNTSIDTNTANSGTSSLLVSNGGCLYQEATASAGQSYDLACYTKRSGSNWTVMELSFLDSNYNRLQSKVTQVGSTQAFSAHTSTGIAPEQTAYALLVLYSEDNTHFDSCLLEESGNNPNPDPDPDPTPSGDNLLTNGGFENNLNGWSSCAQTSLATVSNDSSEGNNALSVSGGGCLYQEFSVQSGEQYSLDCSAKRNGSQYASVTLAMLNNSYSILSKQEVPITSGSYTNYSTSVTATGQSQIGTVVMYGEDPAHFDGCTVVAN